MAEVWGVFEGLKLARSKGYREVEVQLDSFSLVQTLKERSIGCITGRAIMGQIIKLLQWDWVVNFKHLFREANKVGFERAYLSFF